ncbi:Putative cell wall binding repeat 2 [Rathayibacter oskolensis]|uniref:Putative cell wall binding repeat 2 n=1 Tax=Rathayibacter oskolensis TaxID=1891671 RepID=A0A1X7NK75_9MICO|nr:Putative cell wall binding repeat 2 [Rathayibacter oskolensis]
MPPSIPTLGGPCERALHALLCGAIELQSAEGRPTKASAESKVNGASTHCCPSLLRRRCARRTKKTTPQAATRAAIDRFSPGTGELLGGTPSIIAGFEADLRASGLVDTVHRVAGVDRHDTSRLLNDRFPPTEFTDVVYLASATNFADALAAGPAAADHGAPLYLSEPTCIPQATRAALQEHDLDHVTLLGGFPPSDRPSSLSEPASHAPALRAALSVSGRLLPAPPAARHPRPQPRRRPGPDRRSRTAPRHLGCALENGARLHRYRARQDVRATVAPAGPGRGSVPPVLSPRADLRCAP